MRPYFDTAPAYDTVNAAVILMEERAGMLGSNTGQRRTGAVAQAFVLFAAVGACATVKVEAPDKPIEINLNIKIDQEVRIKMDKDVEDAIASNPNLF